jgi:FSR family fosmidomycin resistance protein-like MFS transporter
VSESVLPSGRPAAEVTAFNVILAVGFCHLLNDMNQSLLASIYPMLQENFALSFFQIGILAFVFQVTAALLQPAIGIYTDRHPKPYSLPFAMGFTFVGLLLVAFAHDYSLLVVGSALVGVGSAIFHPESSRVARLASGGRLGLAQSLFQVGGNVGSALGPLLVVVVVLPRGQASVAWFSLAALLGMAVLWWVGSWYARYRRDLAARPKPVATVDLPRKVIIRALFILALLVFSKYIYLGSLSNFYTFYLIETFGVSNDHAVLFLFLHLAAVAAGTIIGGPIGDRIGRKAVIWTSILGVLPFTLALPYANLFWTAVLSVVIGLIIASAFSAIIVFAQELVPSRVGLISGLFFGFAFGIGGIGAAVLGVIADRQGLAFVYSACSFLPLIGLLTVFLPDTSGRPRQPRRETDPAVVRDLKP